MRKTLALILSLSLMAGMMLCVGTVSAEADVVTIQMATSGSADEMIIRQRTADMYMAENPNVKIEMIDIGSDRIQKTMTLISGGEAPDILYLNEFTYVFAEKGILEPLDGYMDGENPFDREQVYEGLLKATTYNGQVYSLPQEVSPFVIYYNKDMFEAAGVPLPKDDWTKEEFLEAAKALTDSEKKVYGYRHHAGGWSDQWLGWMVREGTVLNNPDTGAPDFSGQATLDALNFINQMVSVDKVSMDPASIQAMGMGFDAMFRNQLVAMDSAGLWMLPQYKSDPLPFNWDVVKMPKGSANQNTKAGVLNWGISVDSKHKAEAWDVIKYFMGPVGMKEVADAHMALPGTKGQEALDTMRATNFPPNIQAFISAADELDLSESLCINKTEILTQCGAEHDAMLLGSQTPEETQQRMINIVDEIMNGI